MGVNPESSMVHRVVAREHKFKRSGPFAAHYSMANRER